MLVQQGRSRRLRRFFIGDIADERSAYDEMKEEESGSMSENIAAKKMSHHFVDGAELLKILFSEECRPTLSWLRSQQKARHIPFVKVGRLVFFSPAQVQAAWENSQRGFTR